MYKFLFSFLSVFLTLKCPSCLVGVFSKDLNKIIIFLCLERLCMAIALRRVFGIAADSAETEASLVCVREAHDI